MVYNYLAIMILKFKFSYHNGSFGTVSLHNNFISNDLKVKSVMFYFDDTASMIQVLEHSFV